MLAVMATSVSTSVMAQSSRVVPKDSRSKFHIGAKVGLNISNVYDVDARNFNTAQKSGFMYGGFMAIPITKGLGIQPEVMVSQKGTKATGDIDGVSYSLKRTTKTLDIPLLLQLKPFKMISIVAGPQFSYLLSQKDVYDDRDNTIVTQQFKNQDYRKANIGVVGGIDVHLLGLLLSGRVGCDLQKNTTNNTLAPSYKNMWGQVGVGLRF